VGPAQRLVARLIDPPAGRGCRAVVHEYGGAPQRVLSNRRTEVK